MGGVLLHEIYNFNTVAPVMGKTQYLFMRLLTQGYGWNCGRPHPVGLQRIKPQSLTSNMCGHSV